MVYVGTKVIHIWLSTEYLDRNGLDKGSVDSLMKSVLFKYKKCIKNYVHFKIIWLNFNLFFSFSDEDLVNEKRLQIYEVWDYEFF